MASGQRMEVRRLFEKLPLIHLLLPLFYPPYMVAWLIVGAVCQIAYL